MKILAIVAFSVLAVSLGACSVKEEKTVQQPAPTASASAQPAAPAATTTSKSYSIF